MLSETSRPWIKASVPVLREHGRAIARTFYQQMFEACPELKNLFNLGNQSSGAQQAALSSALIAYAANIDQAEALLPVVTRIAHKHTSVGVKPAHYPIVARHLLGAIRQVLGDAATPDLLAAWDEAYWLLAGELIALEARLYERAQAQAGDLESLVVARVERETEQVVSLYLQRPEGGSPGRFEPGQYVSVAVDLPEGVRQLRQYSLSDAPSRPHWRISIKREPARADAPAGRVSNVLHDQAACGQRLLVSPAYGEFTPLACADERPIALLSGGIGITPLLSALNALADAGSARPILFAHATRTSGDLLFHREIEAARARLSGLRSFVFDEQLSEQGALATAATDAKAGRMRIEPAWLRGFEQASFYLCGPDAFMREQWRALVQLGVSPLRIEREVFGPALIEQLA